MAAPMQAPSADGEPWAPWGDLPVDVLSVIGGHMACSGQLSSARATCSAWKQGIPAGVERLELDMNPCHDAWGAKMEQLQRLTPALSRCKAHVSTAVGKAAFGANIRQLAKKLTNIQHLDLELSEGFELSLDSSEELGELSNLRSLTIAGGVFTAAAAERLLQCLAQACPLLEELRLMPQPTCGLGDDQVAHLLHLTRLKVLEFRAYRLTASGLTRLVRALPQLSSLSCHGLDTCLDAATASCFALSPGLQQLHLGCDFEVPDAALQQLRDVPGGLSMRFRWTDKLAGLLRTARLHLQARLVCLDLGAVRLARDPASSLLEPLAALTALSDLRMRVYSNGEDALTLHLSQLAALSNLQVLHLTKQRAYFAEQRRFSESNISVPLSAAAAASLAAGCRRLRALHLCLGASDVTPEGMAELRRFSSLKSLSVSAEPFGSPAQPVPLDLLQLPQGLTSLELRNIDVITPPGALLEAAAAPAASHPPQQHRGWGPAGSSSSGGGCCGHGEQQQQQQQQQQQEGDGGAAAPGGPRSVLDQLCHLRLESCRLRTAQLQALCLSLEPSLRVLKLSCVAGLTDAGVAALSSLTGLRELSVAAPHNRALSQASLAALAPLRDLRYLTWQSDDLAALGPCLAAFTHFTTLRLLGLSCTRATLDSACGGGDGALLQRIMPYASLDLTG